MALLAVRGSGTMGGMAEPLNERQFPSGEKKEEPFAPPTSYWHVTDRPDFEIDPDYKPMNRTGGRYKKGVLHTAPQQAVQSWLDDGDYLQGRTHAAEIEMPEDFPHWHYTTAVTGRAEHVLPGKILKETQARVKRVVPLEEFRKPDFE